jgi:hypothetical protein
MEQGIYVYVIFYRLPVLLIFSILAVFALTKLRAEPRWRAMFVVWLAANWAGPFLGCFGGFGMGRSTIEPVINGFVSLAFLIPTLLDVKEGRRRDSLHYAGIAVRLGTAGTAVLQFLSVLSPW